MRQSHWQFHCHGNDGIFQFGAAKIASLFPRTHILPTHASNAGSRRVFFFSRQKFDANYKRLFLSQACVAIEFNVNDMRWLWFGLRFADDTFPFQLHRLRAPITQLAARVICVMFFVSDFKFIERLSHIGIAETVRLASNQNRSMFTDRCLFLTDATAAHLWCIERDRQISPRKRFKTQYRRAPRLWTDDDL